VEDDRLVPASSAAPAITIEPLTGLRAGVQYTLSGSSRRHAKPVDFTTADFARIGPEQVLTVTGRSNKERVMSRDSFIRRAREACD